MVVSEPLTLWPSEINVSVLFSPCSRPTVGPLMPVRVVRESPGCLRVREGDRGEAEAAGRGCDFHELRLHGS
jgi:hypothetical protein